MSFFIRGNKAKGSNNKKFNNTENNRKRKASKAKQDVDITSSEDEGLNGDGPDPSSSEDENETAQEKKLRLAKIYLQEIERAEKAKLEKQELNDRCRGDVIQRRLKEDYLKQTGKLRMCVADKYEGFNNVTVLKCKEHKNTVTCFCVDADDKHVYSGSKCGALVKWSIGTGKKIGSIPFVKKNPENVVLGHSKSILAIAISADSNYLAVADESNDIQIWDPNTLKHLRTLKGHRNGVTGLTIRKDTHTLYSASKDRSIKVWSLDEMSYVETLFGHVDIITSIDSLFKERVVTSGGRDRSIRIWKIAEESQLIYNGDAGSIDCVRLINEENFVSGGDDGQICIWGINKKKPLCCIKAAHGLDQSNSQPNWISSVASFVNTDLIATGSKDGFIQLWKLSESCKTVESLFKVPVVGFVNHMAFTSDGNYLIAATGTEHRFGRWDVIKSAKNVIQIISLNKLM